MGADFCSLEAFAVGDALVVLVVGVALLLADVVRLGAGCDDWTSFAVGVAPMGFDLTVADGLAATIFVMAIFWGATPLVDLSGAFALAGFCVAPASPVAAGAAADDFAGAALVFAVVAALAVDAVALPVGFGPETFAAAPFLAAGAVFFATGPDAFSDDSELAETPAALVEPVAEEDALTFATAALATVVLAVELEADLAGGEVTFAVVEGVVALATAGLACVVGFAVGDFAVAACFALAVVGFAVLVLGPLWGLVTGAEAPEVDFVEEVPFTLAGAAVAVLEAACLLLGEGELLELEAKAESEPAEEVNNVFLESFDLGDAAVGAVVVCDAEDAIGGDG